MYCEDDQERQTVYKFNNELLEPPKFGVFSQSQSQFIVTSEDDILFVDMTKSKNSEVDIDEQEGVQNVESVLADEENFYILANKKGTSVGYYLFTINIKNPEQDA